MTTTAPPALDPDKLMAFVFRAVDEVGATLNTALVVMGDPIGAARHVYESLADDGTWMIVEPAAGDAIEQNLTPVGRAYYGFSTLLCTPSSLAQARGTPSRTATPSPGRATARPRPRSC